MNFLDNKKLACFKQSKTLACFAVLLLSLPNSTSVLAQQSSAMSAVYGRGVHAYFAGNTSQADQYFTQVIQAGSTDPRAYYFRAMVKLRMGSQFEAENDMRVGASFEARNPGGHSIGRALQRVQGPGRRTLEKFRRQARLDRLQQGQQQTQQRYEQLNRRGPAVLRREVPVPLGQPIQPPRQLAAPTVPAPGIPAPGIPAPGVITAPPQVQAPIITQPVPAAQPVPAGSGSRIDDDPFGTPAPVTPADDGPFGTRYSSGPAPVPVDPVPTPVPTPAPASEADPFGELPTPTPGPTSSDDDIFGETPAPVPTEEMPAPEETVPETTEADADPFGESSPAPAEADDSDPFGESATDEAADEEMEFDEPAEESSDAPADADDSDPFGESPESTDPADEDDPFGESSDAESEPAEESTESADTESADTESDGDGPAPEDDSAPESDEDDPFDPFGAASGPATAHPAGQFFFALGQWIGSRGQRTAAAPQADAVMQANFELGPTEDNQAVVATAEVASKEDLFGSNETTTDFDDPFAETPVGDARAESEEKPATDSAADDPFSDDPFGE